MLGKELADQLYRAGVAVFPCYSDKGPAVPKGVDWRAVAVQTPTPQQWPSDVVGEPEFSNAGGDLRNLRGAMGPAVVCVGC